MLKHIVAWTFADTAEGTHAVTDRVVELLSRCSDLPGVVEFRLVRPQEGLEASFDLLLESAFTDAEALAAYAQHPLHLEAGAYIGKVRTARWAMDYLVETTPTTDN